MLAMLGQPDGRGFELIVSNWDCPEACARELAKPLNVSAETLLAPASEGRSELSEEAEEGASESQAASSMGEDAIAWSTAVSAMQSLPEQVVLLVRCHEAPHGLGGSTRGQQQDARCSDLGHALLGRLVGCVANAHIAAQVPPAARPLANGMCLLRASLCVRSRRVGGALLTPPRLDAAAPSLVVAGAARAPRKRERRAEWMDGG